MDTPPLKAPSPKEQGSGLAAYPTWLLVFGVGVLGVAAVVVVSLALRQEAVLRHDERAALQRTAGATATTSPDELARLGSALSDGRHIVRLTPRKEGDAHVWRTDDRNHDTICLDRRGDKLGYLEIDVQWSPGLAMLGREAVQALLWAWLLFAGGAAALFHGVIRRRLHLRLTNSEASLAIAGSRIQSLDMILHDLRKPLRAIRETIGEGLATTDTRLAQEAVRDVWPAVDAMIRDVDEMLRPSGKHRQSERVAHQSFAPEVAIAECFRQCVGALQEANVTFSYRFRHVRKIEGDQALVTRMLVNLVVNAVEAMHGKGEIWFATDEVNEGQRPLIRITVGNSDSVISKEDQARLFQASFTKGKVNGIGLGLAFVQLVADSHGGTVSVRSTTETGTEFTVTLPASAGSLSGSAIQLPASADEAKRQVHGGTERSTHSRQIATILVVDDDIFVRESWELVCDDAAVVTFGSPEEVLAKIERERHFLERFDAIITDFYFGPASRLDGGAFAAMLRQTFRGAIVLSSATLLEIPAAQNGIDLQIDKDPQKWSDLLALLEAARKAGVHQAS